MTSAPNASVAVVDDNVRTLVAIDNLLSSAGHSVFLFQSGLELLNDEIFMKVSCVVTDIGMPDIDGFELYRRIRVLREGLPVIFMTGRHLAEDERRYAMSDGSGFFRKPFDASAFLAAVADAVAETNRKPLGEGGSV